MEQLDTIVAFAAVTDFDTARGFYGDTLGLSLAGEPPFAMVAQLTGGTSLRLTKVDEVTPAPYTVLGWKVDDIDATVAELSARGVTFTRYEGMGQDEAGIWTAPGGSRIAWFPDPDGNNLSLTQFA